MHARNALHEYATTSLPISSNWLAPGLGLVIFSLACHGDSQYNHHAHSLYQLSTWTETWTQSMINFFPEPSLQTWERFRRGPLRPFLHHLAYAWYSWSFEPGLSHSKKCMLPHTHSESSICSAGIEDNAIQWGWTYLNYSLSMLQVSPWIRWDHWSMRCRRSQTGT